MSQTTVPRGSALANKQYSKALTAMAARRPTPMSALTGPISTEDQALRKMKLQSTNDMPVVRVDDLSKAAGDVVQVDCAHVVKLRPIMGDRNAEGMGAALKYSTKDIVLDMATLPVSAGGKMTQQRTAHSMRKNAIVQLARGIPAFRFQRMLALAAGARGKQNDNSWILPLATDSEFADMLVNPIKAPTYNRHWVVDGSTLVQGGAQLASVDTTDGMKLSHVDEFAAIFDEMSIKMQPIQIPGDMAAMDDPIKGILMVCPLVYDSLITETGATGIRNYQTNAMQRAAAGKLGDHPLFAPGAILWNGVLVKKMAYAIRFDASDVIPHVTAANRLAATETNVTVAAGLSTTHQVSRSLFLSAQAIASVSGGNRTSEESYSLLENTTNFDRNLELAGEIMGVEEKLRFSLPNQDGDNEVTDFGVAVIDSVVRKRGV